MDFRRHQPHTPSPWVQSGQGPDDHPSSILQQQLEKTLSLQAGTRVSHPLHRQGKVGWPFPWLVSLGLSQIPFLACVGPPRGSVWPRQQSPALVFLESTISAEPCIMGSHGPLWPITAPLTLTDWVWLPEDSQVPTMPTGFAEAIGLSWGHIKMLHSGSVLFSLLGGRGSDLYPPADPTPPRGCPAVLSLGHIP